MSKQIKRKIVSTQKPTESVTKPMPQKKRVVAYCRVSSLAEEQALSFESQKNYYEALLGNAPDVILLRVYGDEGISGLRASKRPEFQKMIDECRKGNIDEIYTKSVSRFARNYAECLVYSRELKRLGICIHFEKEAFTTFDENMEMYFHGTRTIQPTIFFRKFLPNHLHPINLCPDIVAPSAGGRLVAGCLPTCISMRGFSIVPLLHCSVW